MIVSPQTLRQRSRCGVTGTRAPAIACTASAGAPDERDRRARRDRLALADRQALDHARLVGGDLVLHLHRLDDADDLTLLDALALLHEDLPEVALKRRDELVAQPRGAGGAAALAA